MDALDRQILDILAVNARTSYTQIASDIGVATATVNQRVKRLVKSKVIKGYRLELDWNAVGLPVSAIVSIVTRTSQPLSELAADLRALEYVTSCASVTGEFDLNVTVRAASSDHLGEIIDMIRVVADGSTVTALILSNYFEGETPRLGPPEDSPVESPD